MRILAASLIDCENISPKFAYDLHLVLTNQTQHGVSLVARLLVGNPQSLGAWLLAGHGSHLQKRRHHGGKNAADHLIRDEAFKLARQGLNRFYLVSNDADFAITASLLHPTLMPSCGFGHHPGRKTVAGLLRSLLRAGHRSETAGSSYEHAFVSETFIL